MREVLPELLAWWEPARRSASAPWWRRSSPRPARRAPRCWSAPTSTAVGSVSGGCVEGAVYELGQEVVDVRRARCSSGTASPTTTPSPSA